MHNMKLTVAYDGTDFRGWQIQPGQPTIQGLLTDVVRQLTQESVTLQGAGRTDAGVHAWGQVVSFKTQSGLAPQELQRGCNALLPPSIRVRDAEEVGPDFHARWDAQAKTYTLFDLSGSGRSAVPLALRFACSAGARFRGNGPGGALFRGRAGLHFFFGFNGFRGGRQRSHDGAFYFSLRTHRSFGQRSARSFLSPLGEPSHVPRSGSILFEANLFCAIWSGRLSARFCTSAADGLPPAIFRVCWKSATAVVPGPRRRLTASACNPSNIPTLPIRSRAHRSERVASVRANQPLKAAPIAIHALACRKRFE